MKKTAHQNLKIVEKAKNQQIMLNPVLPLILKGSCRKLPNFWLAFCQNWNNLKVMEIAKETARQIFNLKRSSKDGMGNCLDYFFIAHLSVLPLWRECAKCLRY